MKKLIVFSLISLFVASCNSSEEKTADSILNKIEKEIEGSAAIDINLKRPSKTKPNKAMGKIIFNGETIIDNENFQSKITITKNAILVDLTENRNVIALSLKVTDSYKDKPLRGKFSLSATGNEKRATIMTTIAEGNNTNSFIQAPIVYEGELTILKLNNDEVVVEVNGKGGLLEHMHKKENWKPISVRIVGKNPNIISMGVAEETVFF